MSLVFLEGNNSLVSHFDRAVPNFNTNDTYVISGAARSWSDSTAAIRSLLKKLSESFKVDVLLEGRSANNYYAHIEDWDEDDIAMGKGLCLYTTVFELSPLVKPTEVNVDTPQVQPMPEVQG